MTETKLYKEYKKQRDAMELHRAAVHAVLKRMVVEGEAKKIDGPEEIITIRGIIVMKDKALMNRITAWDVDDNGDVCYFFEGDDEPKYLKAEVELW